jgi:DNA-binding IclR family transcriptional regulator
MESPTNDSPKTIEASLKTLDVIESLWKLDGATISELADHLDLPRPTVYFHLATLDQKGYVVTDDGEYRLSLRFQNYGEYVKRAQPLYEIAKPAVEDLAAETGERTYCMVEQHGILTMLCVSKGERALNTDARSGSHGHMHCSAAGKAILAHLDDERVDAILDRWGLPEFTEETITTREELLDSLAEGRERGSFVVMEELERGLGSIGAPILGEDTVVGAVSLEAPVTRIQNSLDDGDLPKDLLATANMIQVNLTFSDS